MKLTQAHFGLVHPHWIRSDSLPIEIAVVATKLQHHSVSRLDFAQMAVYVGQPAEYRTAKAREVSNDSTAGFSHAADEALVADYIFYCVLIQL